MKLRCFPRETKFESLVIKSEELIYKEGIMSHQSPNVHADEIHANNLITIRGVPVTIGGGGGGGGGDGAVMHNALVAVGPIAVLSDAANTVIPLNTIVTGGAAGVFTLQTGPDTVTVTRAGLLNAFLTVPISWDQDTFSVGENGISVVIQRNLAGGFAVGNEFMPVADTFASQTTRTKTIVGGVAVSAGDTIRMYVSPGTFTGDVGATVLVGNGSLVLQLFESP